MSQKMHNDDKYEGPSKWIEALGRANAIGWAGSLAGLIGGGIFAAVSTKENSELAQKGADLIKWASRGRLHISGKWPVIVGGGLLGSQIVHWTGYFLAFAHAKHKAGKGEEQFMRIKAQRDEARGQIAALKEERDALRSEYTEHFKSAHMDEAPQPIVQASSVEASKEQAAQEAAR